MIEERPPTDEDVRRALSSYTGTLRAHYGARLLDVVLFGSRARCDQRPDSDADVAVILANGDWRFWREKMILADLAYEALTENGLVIQPWPIGQSEWEAPSNHRNPNFVVAIKRDARSLVGAT